MHGVVFPRIVLCASLMVLLVSGALCGSNTTVEMIVKKELKSFSAIARSPLINLPKSEAWKRAAPNVRSVSFKSTRDGTPQEALFYNSGSKKRKPLLLALHSWSEDFQQHFSIPYGIWAIKNDWVLMHPDYRGPFTNAKATASEYAIQDILDAMEYARSHALVDESRIYITGFSGGGMATLIMVGRYPEIWAGAAAWVPVYDLKTWYHTTKNASHNYSDHIENSCGGPPLSGSEAENECKKRSVSTYLHRARGKGVPVYIATGIGDVFVPPGHSLKAFNDLALEKDRIAQEDIAYINEHLALPDHLRGQHSDSLFLDAGYKLLFERKSSDVILKVYNGNHDVIYNAGLYWLSRQMK